MRFRWGCWLSGLIVVLGGCGVSDSNPPPLSLDEAAQSFQIHDDFEIELFLGEPDVIDPVDMAFDEDGRVYVAEMIDYPEDPPPGKPARSRIRFLEDTNGDGVYERNVIYAEKVLQVSGLMPWKGGLIVTSAPDILYMKDTDGDGKADIRDVLYTGFPTVNPEGRITNPTLGVDNWIYCANNGANGRITSPAHPEREPLLVRGTDFRFHPIRDLAERSSGPAQYGLTIDDFGNRFITHNTVHLRHVIVPMRYLQRAPLLRVPAMAQDISDHGRPGVRMFPLTEPQQWRVHRTHLRQERYHEHHLDRVEHVAGYITAATGSTIYTGDVFPKPYWGNVFTGDVSGNLVHRDTLAPDGVTFAASRGRENVEFLASTDTWFRPCNFTNGPDGNLYLSDIYRLFIETPESIPEEIKKDMDFWAGDTRGRIWRIRPKQPLRQRSLSVKLGSATTAELVKEIESANGWHRRTAHRLLLERQDQSAAPLLRELAVSGGTPETRVRALWALEGLSSLEPQLVLNALEDEHPRVREQALRLAEGFLARSPAVARSVLTMTDDPDLRVRYQLAYTVGNISGSLARDALADLANRHAADNWFRIAILSSVQQTASEFFHLLLSRGDTWQNADFVAQLSSLIGARHKPAEVLRFLRSVTRLKNPEAGLTGLADGFQLASVQGLAVPGADTVLLRIIENSDAAVEGAAWRAARSLKLNALIRQAEARAFDSDLPVDRRAFAIGALSGGQLAAVKPALEKVLTTFQPAELQVAAIGSLASFDDPSVASMLLAHWKSYAPPARAKTVDALLSRRERAKALMEALEDGRIQGTDIDVAARPRLLEHPDQAIAQRAAKLFAAAGGDRQSVVEAYRNALDLTGEVDNGRQLFEEHCARCHVPGRELARVGPNLSGISNKTKEELLTSILDPSYAIEARYVNYVVTTKDGHMHDGILASETPGSISLRNGSEDGDQTILREDIAEVRASSISVMPDELEKSLDRQGLADVIAYLRGGL